MKISRTQRIGVVVATLAAALAVAGAAQATPSKPAAMTKVEFRALIARSDALNDLYGNAVTRLSPAVFEALWNAGASKLEPQEFVALVTRSEALNRMYKGQAADRAPVSDTSIVWGDFGLGAAAGLGALLIASGLMLGARHGRRRGLGVPAA